MFYLVKARHLFWPLVLIASVITLLWANSPQIVAQSSTDFRPTYGETATYTENGKRIIYQRMAWTEDRIRNIRSLPGNITYEHSFIMNRNSGSEHGPETWAQWAPGLDGIPNRIDASSNFPEWYIDTAAIPGGDGDTAEYTFGTANAKLLQPNVIYWSRMVLEVGDDPDCTLDDSVVCEKAQVTADLGHHRVSCYGPITPPWCIDDDLHIRLKTQQYKDTYWNINVPGSYVWDNSAPGPNPDPDPDPVTPIPPTNDTTPPTMSGYNISMNGGVARLNVSGANDSGSGVSKVRYSAKWNGSWAGIGASSQSPYNIEWNMCDFGVPNGDVEFGVEIWDHAGNKWVWSEHYGNPHATKQHDCSSAPVITPQACQSLVKVALSSPQNGATYSTDFDWSAILYDWNGVANATDYEFQAGRDASFSDLEYNGYYHDETQTVPLNADIGTYYWRVRARNYANGCAVVGPWSDVWTAHVVKTTYTCYVDQLSNPNMNVGLSYRNDCVIFNNSLYAEPDEIYNIGNNDRSAIWLKKGYSITIFDQRDGKGLSKCFNKTTPDLALYTYDGSTVSTDKSLESFYVSTRECYLPPEAPKNFRTTHSNPNSVLFWWDYNRQLHGGYRLYRWSDQYRWQLIADLSPDTEHFYDEDLWCDDPVQYYMLSAYNAYGESAWAGSVAAQTRSCADSAPYAPSYVYKTNTTEDSYTIEWGAGIDLGYKVYERRLRVDSDWRLIATISPNTASSYTVNNLACGTQRDYAITAFNEYAESQMSEVLQAQTTGCTESSPNKVPIPVIEQVGTSVTTITVRWSSTGASAYFLAYFGNFTNGFVTQEFPNTNQSFYTYTLQAPCGTNVVYSIYTVVGDRRSAVSQYFNATTSGCNTNPVVTPTPTSVVIPTVTPVPTLVVTPTSQPPIQFTSKLYLPLITK
jgi:hypothetical protein